jgi:2-polyprenyl-3-methyl-5-hydroxy-6-metoxy-1,4-benzoquinol methylase
MNSLQVPKSIQIAREVAEKNQLNIRFEVVNILDDLSKAKILKQHSYDTVLDAAVFHFFSNENRQHYIQNLEYLIKPGGLYIQIVFSEKEIRHGGPRRINKSEINQSFSSANGWTIESIEDSIYEFTPDTEIGQDGRAYLSLIRRNDKN